MIPAGSRGTGLRYSPAMRESGQNPGVSVLVADDDPVSLRFLELALVELGCSVHAVADGAAAIAAAVDARFDLLILDRRMPGLGGAALLSALRARGVVTAAIATSAELDAATRAELAAAGYAAALAKPLRLEELARQIAPFARHEDRSDRVRSAATAQAGDSGRADPPLLDDAVALAAIGGDVATLKALRILLADDLRTLLSRTSRLDASLVEDLHRLRAACRYCGATALEQAALAIDSELRDRATWPRDAWEDFIACCENTCDALAQGSPSA